MRSERRQRGVWGCDKGGGWKMASLWSISYDNKTKINLGVVRRMYDKNWRNLILKNHYFLNSDQHHIDVTLKKPPSLSKSQCFSIWYAEYPLGDNASDIKMKIEISLVLPNPHQLPLIIIVLEMFPRRQRISCELKTHSNLRWNCAYMWMIFPTFC